MEAVEHHQYDCVHDIWHTSARTANFAYKWRCQALTPSWLVDTGCHQTMELSTVDLDLQDNVEGIHTLLWVSKTDVVLVFYF